MSTVFLTEPYDSLLATCVTATDLALCCRLFVQLQQTQQTSTKLLLVTAHWPRFDSQQTLLHAASQPDSMLLVEQGSISLGVPAEDSAS